MVTNLSPKTVHKYKAQEVRKQLVSNNSLKAYFKMNPQDKDFTVNDA